MTATVTTATTAYQKANVAARSPLELVVMLYDGALSSVSQARHAFAAGDLAAKAQALSKSLALVDHLQSTLNMDEGKEIAEQLDRLYVFVTDKLIEFNVHGRAEALDEASRVLATLREAWTAIARTGEGTGR